ncbi:MAG: outer membrane lipoprotein LolB [Marinospirillum sp.]|uniref:lipoprotein insertase outer membrane protein LolB n=1 Tax=Marinospirillum sp. TaxID=2183934 RepID=UPI001A0B077E|nr:lipoprotein insertase outer membrane protein LolB [Marinospirillum sp.]MBE0506624.1 outer membrane lipoprotein LolB [Marinospirillum sp.]
MPHTLKALALFLLMLFLLGGCSSQPLAPPPPEAQQANSHLWHWQIQGRIALNDGSNSHSATLDWQQQGYHYQLQIFGPLGQGSARLDGQPFRVSLTTSDGEVLMASSPEQLLQQGLGWNFPLSDLIYWVRGIPAPGVAIQISDNQLEQNGWLVEWRRYTLVNGHQLPQLLLASNGRVQLRLAINQWQVSEAQPATQPAP